MLCESQTDQNSFVRNIRFNKSSNHKKKIKLKFSKTLVFGKIWKIETMVYGRKYKGLGYLRKVSTQLNWKVDST